jgi:hypothetical protein
MRCSRIFFAGRTTVGKRRKPRAGRRCQHLPAINDAEGMDIHNTQEPTGMALNPDVVRLIFLQLRKVRVLALVEPRRIVRMRGNRSA